METSFHPGSEPSTIMDVQQSSSQQGNKGQQGNNIQQANNNQEGNSHQANNKQGGIQQAGSQQGKQTVLLLQKVQRYICAVCLV